MLNIVNKFNPSNSPNPSNSLNQSNPLNKLNPCSFCPAHCCKNYIITVTAFDALRVCKNTGKKAEEFCSIEPAKLLSFDPDTTLDMKDDPFTYILAFKSHPCIFLGADNRCTIHNFAPLSCKRYPHKADKESGSINARFCPAVSRLLFSVRKPDISLDQYLPELEAYKKIVKEWNANPGKKDACLGFLLEKVNSELAIHPFESFV